MCVCVILVQHPLATKKPGFAPELESAAAAGHAGAWEGDGAPVQGEAAFRGTRDLAQSRLLPFLARRRNHGKEKNLKNPSRTAARRNLMAKTLSLPSLVFLFVSLSLSLSLFVPMRLLLVEVYQLFIQPASTAAGLASLGVGTPRTIPSPRRYRPNQRILGSR